MPSSFLESESKDLGHLALLHPSACSLYTTHKTAKSSVETYVTESNLRKGWFVVGSWLQNTSQDVGWSSLSLGNQGVRHLIHSQEVEKDGWVLLLSLFTPSLYFLLNLSSEAHEMVSH